MGEFLFITTKGDWGGSEPLWCEAAGRALAEGHCVTVVLPRVAKLARPVGELVAKGAKVVMRPPRARPTLLRRLEWKAKRIRKPETQWWRTHFPEPFYAICVSQGGAYCVMNMPGLANWLMEIDTPFVLVGHSHRAYALPSIEIRPRIRELFGKAFRVCFDAAAHIGAAKRYLATEFQGLAVQNPVNLEEEKDKTDLTTDDTDGHGYQKSQQGCAWASQARAAFSNPFTSELPRDSENTSLTRSADGPALALRAGGMESGGGNQLADSTVFLEGQSQAGLQMGNHKHQPVRAANDSAASRHNSSSVLIRDIRGSNSEAFDAKAPEALMACVARFEVRDKGQDLLLEALGDPVWRERDFQLDFFGSGPDREILEDLISFYGLGDKVRIVGFESDIRKIWKEHGLLVLPSLSEGTPISLIEAQLCGRASLVTRVDGNPEWVEEGKTGFLAEAPTVHHLRLALERAWENRHRWAEMGEAARAACLAKRDPDPAGTLLALLRKAAERG